MYECALFSKVESLITDEGQFCGKIKYQLLY